jgi:Uma2 family endonuclease
MSATTLDPTIEEVEADVEEEPKVHLWTRDEYYKMADAGLFFQKHVELIEGQVLERYEDPDPRPYLWTRDDYYRMLEVGLFEGKRVELIEGQVIEMSAMKSPHATALSLVAEALRPVFADECFIRVQSPLRMTLGTEADPEPDIALIEGNIRDYANEHPSTAWLVVEISETTLKYDRNRKASIYARAMIDEYWIVNLKQRQLEVYRHSTQDAIAPLGFKYRDKLILKAGDTVSPMMKPEAVIAVADLLP